MQKPQRSELLTGYQDTRVPGINTGYTGTPGIIGDTTTRVLVDNERIVCCLLLTTRFVLQR
eukprot:1734044-Rhodomonas_salina.2